MRRRRRSGEASRSATAELPAAGAALAQPRRRLAIVAAMTETAQSAIETMLLEERRYPPSPEFAAQANAKPEHLRPRPLEFWGDEAPRARHLVRAVRRSAASGSCRTRSGSSAGSSTSPTTASTVTSRTGNGDKVAYYWEGEPDGRPPRAHLRRSPARDDEARERAQVARRDEGHAGRDLHGHGPGDADRDARVRADRRAAHGRLRRLLGRVALRPPARTWAARC